ncbi:hypothetical protein D3C72_1582830 [compost metagenome]
MPAIGDPLGQIGRLVRFPFEDVERRHRLLEHGFHIQPGAEGAPLPVQDHCPQPPVLLQLAEHLIDGAEHGPVQRIELVPPRQHHLGDAVPDLPFDPWFIHVPCPLLSRYWSYH